MSIVTKPQSSSQIKVLNMLQHFGNYIFGTHLNMGIRRKAAILIFVLLCLYPIWTTLSLPTNWSLDDIIKTEKEPGQQLWKREFTSSSPALKDSKILSNLPKISQTPEMTPSWRFLTNISEAYNKKWVGFPEILGKNCTSAFDSNVKSNGLYPRSVGRKFENDYLSESQDCESFLERHGFYRYPEASEEEKNFPLAFIMLFYKDLDQILFFLRAIYRVHNVYCLSVDTKSSVEFLMAVQSISKCLPNVFVASKLESIVYAGFERLMADIDCMKDLIQHPVQWKYVINLPGQQFPLRTNLEMVKIIKMYNGANDVEGVTGTGLLESRVKYKYANIRKDDTTGKLKLVRVHKGRNGPPPHNIEVVKGSAYGTFSRAFIDWLLRDQRAKDFLQWSKTVRSPDEYYWATLHHSKVLNPPGGYIAGPPGSKKWLSSFSVWINTEPCATIFMRHICILSPDDLPMLMTKYALFANKFYITHHPAALHCLDEMLFNMTVEGATRDLKPYQKLVSFALQHNATAVAG